jgi:hypothetical protein
MSMAFNTSGREFAEKIGFAGTENIIRYNHDIDVTYLFLYLLLIGI